MLVDGSFQLVALQEGVEFRLLGGLQLGGETAEAAVHRRLHRLAIGSAQVVAGVAQDGCHGLDEGIGQIHGHVRSARVQNLVDALRGRDEILVTDHGEDLGTGRPLTGRRSRSRSGLLTSTTATDTATIIRTDRLQHSSSR